jgi:hypothetical protein
MASLSPYLNILNCKSQALKRIRVKESDIVVITKITNLITTKEDTIAVNQIVKELETSVEANVMATIKTTETLLMFKLRSGVRRKTRWCQNLRRKQRLTLKLLKKKKTIPKQYVCGLIKSLLTTTRKRVPSYVACYSVIVNLRMKLDSISKQKCLWLTNKSTKL